MKNIILCILLLSSFAVSAQKIRFSDKRNQWVYHCTGNPDSPAICDYNKTITFGTDTFMYGQTYQRLIDTVFRDPALYARCGFFSSFWYYNFPTGCFIREDTVANRVYWISTLIDSTERILFDYNLHLGDTIRSNVLITDSVACLDSFMIGAYWYKIFDLVNKQGSFGNSFRLIEGVGTIDWINLAMDQTHFEHDERLLCFSQSGYYPAIAAPLCGSGGAANVFENSINCAVLSVNVSEHSQPTISISPNPAFADISVKSDIIMQSLTITNITGQVVRQIDCNSKDVVARVDDLHSGLYFLSVRYGEQGEYVFHYQIVKE